MAGVPHEMNNSISTKKSLWEKINTRKHFKGKTSCYQGNIFTIFDVL